MNRAKALLTLLFSALGIFGANEYYKPKNVKDLLKWRGVKLASGNRVWKSMFFENKKELSEFGIYSEDALWSWCSERFKQSNLNDENELGLIKNFCSDSATSIMGRIIREGEESKVIDKEDIKAFSINYILTGRDSEALKAIGLEGNEKNATRVGRQLSEWCEKEKTTKVLNSGELSKLENFKKRCYNRNVSTVEQLLGKLKKRVMNEKEFESLFSEKLKYAPKLVQEIENYYYDNVGLRKLLDSLKNKIVVENGRTKRVVIEENQLTKEYGGKILKSWCQSKLKIDLADDDIYPKTFGFFVSRCTTDLN